MEQRCGKAFTQGFICAVADIIRLHDQPTIAADVLRAIGKIDWSVIAQFDRATLAQHGLAPARYREARDE